MSIARLSWISALFTTMILIHPARRPRPPFNEGKVWEETLWTARDAGVDYLALANSAIEGDSAALDRLLQFSTRVDAAGGIGHGIVLVKILLDLGDEVFAEAVQELPDRDKRMLRALLDAGLDYGTWRVPPDSLHDYFPITEMAIR